MAIERPEALAAATSAEVDDLRLGIVGAGKFGTTLARAAVAAGYDVAISGSGPADDIALTVDVLAPGARATTTDEVVRHADVIVLAVPTHRFRELSRDRFAGKILIDAMNYWEPVDGDDPELTPQPTAPARSSNSTSPPHASSRASTNSATTNSKRTYAQAEHPTASRSAPPATTASPSARSCGSSTGSGSTPSTPGRSRTAWPWNPTARPSPPPTAQKSSPSWSRINGNIDGHQRGNARPRSLVRLLDLGSPRRSCDRSRASRSARPPRSGRSRPPSRSQWLPEPTVPSCDSASCGSFRCGAKSALRMRSSTGWSLRSAAGTPMPNEIRRVMSSITARVLSDGGSAATAALVTDASTGGVAGTVSGFTTDASTGATTADDPAAAPAIGWMSGVESPLPRPAGVNTITDHTGGQPGSMAAFPDSGSKPHRPEDSLFSSPARRS